MSSLHLPIRPLDGDSALPQWPEPATHLRVLERLELRVALWLLLRHARRHGPSPTTALARAAAHSEAHRTRLNHQLRERRELATVRARALDGTGL